MNKGFAWRHLWVVLALVACGGALGSHTDGGESHFLRACEDSCSEGLACLSGVCTRPCRLGQDVCSDLSPRALCTNPSVAPGSTAVCDVGCQRTADCATLGNRFLCNAGFCREEVSEVPAGNGGSGGSSAPASGGASAAGVFAPQCERNEVDSECTFEATCEELRCGDGLSWFGDDGCRRPACESSDDCGAGERCRFTLLEARCFGSETGGCSVEPDGSCACVTTDDCATPDFCVEAERYPASEDCLIADDSCQEALLSPSLEKRAAAQACQQKLQAKCPE